jgi:AcrR family transcriptional regulator
MPGTSQVAGRARQKHRTRVLLLRAAGELVKQGTTPTVTEVADAAEVSRRTAYRYFPTQQQLLSEVVLEQLRPGVDRIIQRALQKGSPEQSLDLFVSELQHLTIRHQAALRTMVKLSLDGKVPGPKLPARGYRRVEWIEGVLAAVRPHLTKRSFDRLVSGLTLCVGIDALIALTNIRGLSGKESTDVCRWVGRVLLQASLRDRKKPANRDTVSR